MVLIIIIVIVIVIFFYTPFREDRGVDHSDHCSRVPFAHLERSMPTYPASDQTVLVGTPGFVAVPCSMGMCDLQSFLMHDGL